MRTSTTTFPRPPRRDSICDIGLFALIGVMCLTGSARAGALVSTLRLPDDGNHPQVVTDGRGRVHLIYFKGDASHGDLFYVRSDDGGKNFTSAIRVNSQGQSVIVIGTIRGPQMAIGKGDRIHVSWMGSSTAEPKALGNAVPLLYARMNDAGNGFEGQRNMIQGHPGLDGGGSIAADAEGNVYVAWHAPEGEAKEANRRVWISRSKDEGKTFDAEWAASADGTGACGCCGMKISASAGGRVFVLYRTATQIVHRDMVLLESQDYGRTFKSVNSDPWEIGMCVMSTAALLPVEDTLLAAWETHEQIYVLNMADEATAHSATAVPGSGSPRKHPSIAVNGRGEYIVAWTEGTGWNKGGAVAWQVYGKDGKAIADASGKAGGLPVWGVPAVFVGADETFKIIY